MKHKQVADHIIAWLSDYLTNSKLNGFVLGISGGIDSALTSTLCAHTGAAVLCLEMPIHQAEDQVSRAAKHIDWLQQNFPNVKRQTVDLTKTFDTFCSEVMTDPALNNVELSLANTRARLRMTTLYYFAGIHGSLVAGTGNKVEDFGVGFFTKYGDGGVDISPIADLYKSEVYALAGHLGINQEIIKAKPTDGLWKDNRTDEEQIGATYDELEWAMEQKETDNPNWTERQKEVIAIYTRLHKLTQHKINPIPVCKIPKDLLK